MKLSEKYGIPEATIKAMIKDGLLSSLIPRDEEIIAYFEAERKKGVGSKQAAYNVSVIVGLTDRQVENIVKKFK